MLGRAFFATIPEVPIPDFFLAKDEPRIGGLFSGAYGVGGIFGDEDDNRAHGRDERILTKSFDDAVDFMYDVVTGLAKN